MRVSRSCSGGRQPHPDEVAANLRAGVPATRRRALPDVRAWADFTAAPELVHKRLGTRLREGRCPYVASTFPTPKPGNDEMRAVASLDLYDELYYRILVGRVSPIVDRALGPDVFSYRLENAPPGWSVRDIQAAFELRRERGEALYADNRCNAMGVADIRHYYPSVRLGTLMETLGRLGLTDESVGPIVNFLGLLPSMGAPPGLPVDLESSGLLANAVLIGLDDAMAGRVLGHVRLTDDSWLYLQSEADWPDVYGAYVLATAELGLKVNTSKVAVYSKGSGEAEHVMQHGHIAYLMSRPAGHRAPEEVTEELGWHLDQPNPDWDVISFLLGELNGDAEGLKVLYTNPEMFDEIPGNVGRYLLALAGDRRRRKKIDADWLIDRATTARGPRSLAGQLQACRVASRLRMSKAHGKRLEELATDSNSRQYSPLQAWAATAWGASDAHRPGRAVECAEHSDDFMVRRAFALTVHPTASTPSKRSRWCQKLSSVDADLEPTLARLR